MKKQMEKCQFCNNMFGNTQMLKQHQKKTKYCLKIQSKLLSDAAKEKEETINIDNKLTCSFCSKQFKTKYLLTIHQTQTKYCLKIQESQNFQNIIECLFTCNFCEKKFSTKHFNRHDSTCKKKIQFLLNQKDQENIRLKDEKNEELFRIKIEKAEEIAKMKTEKEKEIGSIYKAAAERAQATIDEIAKQPTYQKNSTRNIQNNLMISSLTPLDLAQARVDSIIDEKYTKNDFYEGQKGAAHIIHKHILTDNNGKSQIVCTDTERGTFHHIDINGDHVIDYKNVHLINRVHLPLKRKAGKFAAEEYVKNPSASKEIIMNETSIRELEYKPGLFNRTLAQLTRKNCARPLSVESSSNIILSITEGWLLENTKFLTIEHILRGADGYADYALSYPLCDRLLTDEDYYNSDSKTSILRYIDDNGIIITDYGGKILTAMIMNSLRERNKILKEENTNEDIIFPDLDDLSFQEEFIELVMSNI
jgi:hypothetical protein